MLARWMRILGLVCSVASWIYVKICCPLGKYSYEMKVCSEVCCGSSGRSWSSSDGRNYGGKVFGMTWSNFCRDPGGNYSYICGYGARSGVTESGSILVIVVSASGVTMMSRGGSSTPVIGVCPACAGVPDGSILSRQSMATCP